MRKHLFFLFFFFACYAFAGLKDEKGVDYYEYHPKMSLDLGSGFSKISPTKSFYPCIEFETEEHLEGPGTFQSEIVIRSAKSQAELDEALGISMTVSANVYFAQGSAGGSHFTKNSVSDSSLSLVLSARSDFGHVGIKRYKLMPEFQKLLENKQYEEFENSCGTHFIDQEHRAGGIFVIYTLHDLSESQKTQIKTALKVGGTYNILTSEVQQEFQKIIAQTAKNHFVDLRILTLGGRGLSPFSKVPSNLTDLNAITKLVGDYFHSLNSSQSAPVGFHVASMEIFGYKQASLTTLPKRDYVLKQSYLELEDYLQTLTKLQKILRNWNNKYKLIAEESKQYYIDSYLEIGKMADAIHTQAQACFDDPNSCQYAVFAKLPPMINWPEEEDQAAIEKISRVSDQPVDLGLNYEALNATRCFDILKRHFLKTCITKVEFEIIRKLNGFSICDEDNHYVGWAKCY